MHPNNDRVLQWVRARYGWVVSQMRGLDRSELALFVLWFIGDRFGRGLKPTYAYEIAWVFQRDKSTIAKVLRGLEHRGDIERVSHNPKLRLTFYLPKWGYVKYLPKYAESEQGPDGFQIFYDKHCPQRTVLALVPSRK